MQSILRQWFCQNINPYEETQVQNVVARYAFSTGATITGRGIFTNRLTKQLLRSG